MGSCLGCLACEALSCCGSMACTGCSKAAGATGASKAGRVRCPAHNMPRSLTRPPGNLRGHLRHHRLLGLHWRHVGSPAPQLGSWCVQSILRGRITLTSAAVLDLCSKFDCMGELVVYRMTFGLALFHIFMSLLMIGVRDSSDWRFSLQNGTSRLHSYHMGFSCDRRVVDCEGARSRRSHRHRLRYSHRFLRGTLATWSNCPTYPVSRPGDGFA